MGLREVFTSVGRAAVLVGAGAFLALIVAACGESQTTGVQPAALQGEEIVAQPEQTVVQPQLPTLDMNAPLDFQTATFAFG